MENYIKFKYVRLYQMVDNNKRYTEQIKKLHSWCGKYNLLSLSSSCHVHFVIQHGKKDGKITMQRKNVCLPGNDFSLIPFDEYKQKTEQKNPFMPKQFNTI